MTTLYTEKIHPKIYIEPLHRPDQFGFRLSMQLWPQLLSSATIITAVDLLILLLIHLFAPQALTSAIILAALIGGLLGIFVPISSSRPLCMTIQTQPEGNDYWLDMIEQRLVFFGYRHYTSEAGHIAYRSQFPRWLRWRENEFHIEQPSATANLTLVGPAFPLKFLSSKLLLAAQQI